MSVENLLNISNQIKRFKEEAEKWDLKKLSEAEQLGVKKELDELLHVLMKKLDHHFKKDIEHK